MCIDAYLQQVASELSGEAELSTVLPLSTPVQGPANNPAGPQVVRAGPAHMYMCGQACILGAMHATEKATTKLFDGLGPTEFKSVWEDEFRGYTQVPE